MVHGQQNKKCRKSRVVTPTIFGAHFREHCTESRGFMGRPHIVIVSLSQKNSNINANRHIKRRKQKGTKRGHGYKHEWTHKEKETKGDTTWSRI
jgi:hypothetical protein